MLEQDDLLSLEVLMKNVNINEMKQYVPTPINIDMPKIPEVIIPPNPVHETNRILAEQTKKIDDLSDKLEKANLEISKQTKELQSIHYENMKLNAQIDVLNKTIDSQNNELERLRDINVQLKNTNNTLSNNTLSKKDWKLSFISFISGIIVAVIGGIILHIFIG